MEGLLIFEQTNCRLDRDLKLGPVSLERACFHFAIEVMCDIQTRMNATDCLSAGI